MQNHNGSPIGLNTETSINSKPQYKPLKIGNRTINVRNWKVRDRIKLKELLKEANSEKKQQEIILDVLVYNCIEGKVALNEDELEYLFAQLRVNSVGDDIRFKYTCPNEDCNEQVELGLKISNVYKPKFKKLSNITVSNINIELQEVQNIDYYNRKMKESTTPSLTDLILHIKSLNNEQKSENQILHIFEELDTKDMDTILDKWDSMRFTLDRVNNLKCPYCGREESFEFDEIPDILPQTWLRR